MNTKKEELLSAFLDDESGDFERRRLIDELKKDDELGQTLSRYAFIGEAVRAGKSQSMGTGVSLLSRIQAELEDEPAYTQDSVVQMPARATASATVTAPKVHSYRWLGMGLAATVAAVTVGSLLFVNQPAAPTAQMAAALPAVSTGAVTAVADAGVTDARLQQVGRIDPQTRDILKQYVAQHVKYASTTVIAPSIRVISYAND
jgi:negative regulator of sigma E activity